MKYESIEAKIVVKKRLLSGKIPKISTHILG